MVDVVKTLFETRGDKATVRTETAEQRADRQRRADERARQVFGLTPAQERVLRKARAAR